ncbi:MAG: hypothetical protein SVX38_10745, partial [Chloroflexota bacterium]|nr:hypothetical protein [Chloroflexota bacterium]
MYTLIKGHFHVVGYSPDGDSIKFKAKNDARWRKVRTEHWEALTQRLAEDGGAVMLRLQGIDALETHYTPATLPTPKELGQQVAIQQEKPEPGSHKQPAELAELAAAELMCMLGVKRVEWRSWGKNTWISKVYVEKRGKEVCCEEKQEDKIPGYILTRDVDRKGRPIAWVFPGSASDRDGARLTPDQLLSRIEQSANDRLLKLGLV